MLEGWDGEIDWGIDEREEWEAKVSADAKVVSFKQIEGIFPIGFG
jgi:hypothetical protein